MSLFCYQRTTRYCPQAVDLFTHSGGLRAAHIAGYGGRLRICLYAIGGRDIAVLRGLVRVRALVDRTCLITYASAPIEVR